MDKKTIRQAFGDELLELGKEYPNLYVIDADIGKSCKTVDFQKTYPNQHVNVGIAEQNCAGVAAGLATLGNISIISTYAIFGSLRMTEQIRQEVCYPNLNVKIMCSHGGVTPASDGASHQAIEDLGVMRTLPNMTVIAPADYNSARVLIRKAVKKYGPVYMRFTRDAFPVIYNENEKIEIGKGNLIKNGTDVAIISNGDVLYMAIEASEILEKQGKSVTLIDMHTIKPLDKELVIKTIDTCGIIITVEDHNIINGLGSAVSEVIAEYGKGKLKRMGMQDQFGESGPYEDILSKNGVSANKIAKVALNMLD